MTIKLNYILTLFLILAMSLNIHAQEKPNYDESKVGEYTLPKLLKLNNGRIITTKEEWMQKRRPEILQLFKDNIYGDLPEKTAGLHFKLLKQDVNALAGKAISKQIRVFFTKKNDAPYMDVLIYLPKIKEPAPVFVGLNFKGNQSVNADPAIIISEKHPVLLIKTNKDSNLVRGEQAERWEVEILIKNGYGVATAYYGDLELDYSEGWKTGIRTSLQKELNTKPAEWSAIGAWAWGLSRILDYMETDPQIDAKKVIVHGHSRLGKSALWAGANDQRFAAVISNNSGEGGAALARRCFGETTARINTSFPHWFVAKYKKFNDNATALPIDQHMLLALIAPRPLYVASATLDLWADPKGEFLSAKYAELVFKLFGKKGLAREDMPAPDTSVGETVRYHIRTGKHSILLFDWQQYMDFAKENLK